MMRAENFIVLRRKPVEVSLYEKKSVVNVCSSDVVGCGFVPRPGTYQRPS